MLNHIEQLIELLALEYGLKIERLEDKPPAIADLNFITKFHKEMEDGIVLVVVPDETEEVFHIYGEDGTPYQSVRFEEFDLAYEELETYADEIIEA